MKRMFTHKGIVDEVNAGIEAGEIEVGSSSPHQLLVFDSRVNIDAYDAEFADDQLAITLTIDEADVPDGVDLSSAILVSAHIPLTYGITDHFVTTDMASEPIVCNIVDSQDLQAYIFEIETSIQFDTVEIEKVDNLWNVYIYFDASAWSHNTWHCGGGNISLLV